MLFQKTTIYAVVNKQQFNVHFVSKLHLYEFEIYVNCVLLVIKKTIYDRSRNK